MNTRKLIKNTVSSYYSEGMSIEDLEVALRNLAKQLIDEIREDLYIGAINLKGESTRLLNPKYDYTTVEEDVF